MVSLDLNAQEFEKVSKLYGKPYSYKDYLDFGARKEVFDTLAQQWNVEGFGSFEFVLRKLEQRLSLDKGAKVVYPCSGMDNSVAKAFPQRKYYTIANDNMFFPGDSCGYSKIIVDRFSEHDKDYKGSDLVVLKRASNILPEWSDDFYFLGYGNILKSGGYLLVDNTTSIHKDFESSSDFKYIGYFDIKGIFFENSNEISGVKFLLFRKK